MDRGWGESSGQGEWQEEKAGEAIANEENKDTAWDADKNEAWKDNDQPATIPEEGGAAAEVEPELEDNSKSFADYMAEQAQKKLEGLGMKEARAPNEGAKDNKKWKSAKELVKEEDGDYFKGEDKARRERERGRNAKEFLDIDYAFKEQPRDARGGGRGGGRGRGRGRGDGDRADRPDRGDRPERPDRPERAERGEFRGRGRGRGGESRGEFRGGRGRGRGGSEGGPVPVNDEKAFPSLGGK